jgi:formylglycine-generating enzyme required for sulfatase activity
MGSPEAEEDRDADEGPVHKVRISPFACMRVPVTRRVYAEVLGEDPGWPEGAAADRPVNNVSWFDAIRFCNSLSEREGLSPCYQIASEAVTWQFAANGYRLLTEAEWEYACRAGSTGSWSFGDGKLLEKHAWFEANSGGEPHPVGTRKPNRWGLYDMQGNVWEWCWDWYGPYTSQPQADPVGAEDGSDRSLRGGAFITPRNLRSAIRGWFVPENRNRIIGFRCARGARR